MRVVALYLAVAAGGLAGGGGRWMLTGSAASAMPPLLLVNGFGCLLVGLLLAFSDGRGRRQLPAGVSTSLMIGFCGALTTFSAFALQSLRTLQTGEYYVLVLQLGASLAVWLAAVIGGYGLGRLVNRHPVPTQYP